MRWVILVAAGLLVVSEANASEAGHVTDNGATVNNPVVGPSARKTAIDADESDVGKNIRIPVISEGAEGNAQSSRDASAESDGDDSCGSCRTEARDVPSDKGGRGAAVTHRVRPNPAAAYCEQLGYTYKVVSTPQGETGVCVVEPGRVEFDAWDFYRGKIGQAYSYAARHGYDIRTERIERESHVEEYAVCVSRGPGNREIPLLQLMEENGEPLSLKSIKEEATPAPSSAGDKTPQSLYTGLKADIPSSFDWRSYGGHAYIGSVRDQGNCGSCYAFGALASAEGVHNVTNALMDENCSDFSEAFLAFCLSFEV